LWLPKSLSIRYPYYESGQRMVPPSVLCALADFYGVSVDYILGRTNHKKTNK
jgi:transcriptional regulator with XRE-family HTH domain